MGYRVEMHAGRPGEDVQRAQHQPHLMLRPSSGVDWACVIGLAFPPIGPGDYISLPKLPTGVSLIFKLRKVRETLVSYISDKVPLYCPSVQSKAT